MTTDEMWSRMSPEHQKNVFCAKNMYYAYRELRHEPDRDEAIRYYFFNVTIPYTVHEFLVYEEQAQVA